MCNGSSSGSWGIRSKSRPNGISNSLSSERSGTKAKPGSGRGSGGGIKAQIKLHAERAVRWKARERDGVGVDRHAECVVEGEVRRAQGVCSIRRRMET